MLIYPKSDESCCTGEIEITVDPPCAYCEEVQQAEPLHYELSCDGECLDPESKSLTAWEAE